MNNALDTRHPLQRLADRLRLVAICQDSADLLACLAGKGMPSLSREGDEPAELIWESLSRYLQPDKAMLDLFADILAQASRKFLEKLAELMAQAHAVAVNEGVTASAGVPDAGWQEYEPLAFNLTLLASYLPAHPNLFNAMQACYEEGLNLGSILGGRVPKSLHNALVMQQTDNRYAKRWFDELITLVQNSVSLVHSAQRVQAMQAWQALLLVPDEIDSIQHTSSLSHRALVAAMGDDFENDPNRQRLVRQMLERISKIHVGGDFVWRDYFSTAHGWHTLLVAFAEDIWLDENDPDRLLDSQNYVTWRTGLSLTQRQRIRQSYTQADKHDWDLAWDDVFRTSSAPREKLMALRTQLNNTKPELSKTHRPTKQDFRHLQEEAKMAPALSKPPKGVIDYSQPTSADQYESVQKALQDIEKQLRNRHESVAVKRADELIKQQQKRQAKAELIAKTASSVATLFAEAGDLTRAQAWWQQAIQIQPHDVVARCGLADTLKAQDKLVEAEALYRETMSQFLHAVVARNGLAETLKAQDKLAEAEVLYRETMSQFPHAVVARCGLADTLKAQDKLAEAEALYRETMSQFPHDVVARCGLAETLKAQDKLAEAEVLYRETMSQFPHAVVARNGLADTLKAQDKLAEAEALYRETMSQFPHDVVARCGLAETLKAQAKLAEAEALYRETMSQFPHAVVVCCGLADTLKAQDKLAEAEVLYRETMSQFPHDVVARNGLANVLRKQKRYAEALECLPKPSDKNYFLDQVVLTLIEADRGQFDAAIQRLNDSLIAPRSKEADKQRLLALLTSVQIRAGHAQEAWKMTQSWIEKCRYASQNLIVIHSAWVAGKELDVEARIKQFPPQSGLEKMVWKLLQKCRENSLATSDDELFEKECDMLLAV